MDLRPYLITAYYRGTVKAILKGFKNSFHHDDHPSEKLKATFVFNERNLLALAGSCWLIAELLSSRARNLNRQVIVRHVE
eukprot:SAG11_NODE_33867_length_275_cov_0.579545_1_plen_79_part_10